jgi:hypothetical protein
VCPSAVTAVASGGGGLQPARGLVGCPGRPVSGRCELLGDEFGDAAGLVEVDGGRPVGGGEVQVHRADAAQPAAQGQGQHAADQCLLYEQIVEGRPPARQQLLGGEHGHPAGGGEQTRSAADGELQPLHRRGELAAGRQRRPQVRPAVDAQPDPVDRQHRSSGTGQSLGQQVRIVPGAGMRRVDRLREATDNVHPCRSADQLAGRETPPIASSVRSCRTSECKVSSRRLCRSPRVRTTRDR